MRRGMPRAPLWATRRRGFRPARTKACIYSLQASGADDAARGAAPGPTTHATRQAGRRAAALLRRQPAQRRVGGAPLQRVWEGTPLMGVCSSTGMKAVTPMDKRECRLGRREWRSRALRGVSRGSSTAPPTVGWPQRALCGYGTRPGVAALALALPMSVRGGATRKRLLGAPGAPAPKGPSLTRSLGRWGSWGLAPPLSPRTHPCPTTCRLSRSIPWPPVCTPLSLQDMRVWRRPAMRTTFARPCAA